ncbi:MAG: Pvc16 family protein [Deltaproteobacteria bacterium]|nr:Pvc16 family protein [Deltaproteobacteria bacterium]
MSAQHAIAAVTQVLRTMLTTPVDAQVPGATVSVGPPDAVAGPAPDNRVNVFLYRVSPNTALRSHDIPTRRGSGQLMQRPVIAVDLHYMVTCFGDEVTLVPQRLLGTVLSTLHASPMLSRDRITAALAPPEPLADSGLEDQRDLVKFQLEALSNEELSRLWSTLLQTKYALSVAYRASTVLIEEPVAPVQNTPVEERRVHVVIAARPMIEAGEVVDQPTAAITAERMLLLRGNALSARPAELWFGDVVTTDYETRAEGLRVTPPSTVRAGVVGVRVVHPVVGQDSTATVSETSNVVAVPLRPVISALPSVVGDVLTIEVLPEVHLDQTATVRLEEVATGSVARLAVDLEQARILAGLPEQTTSLSTVMVQLPALPGGVHRVRLEVDGLPNVGTADGSIDRDPEVVL